MNRDERDLDQLHVVLRYCDRLEEAVARFGNSFETFETDTV